MDQVNQFGQSATLIHFTYEVSDGDWRIACMPNMTEFYQTPYHQAYQRSNDSRAATCPACKRAQAAVAAIGATAQRGLGEK